MAERLVRVDLHVHSSASWDCDAPPGEVARRCRSLGLGPVFLTDHDTIGGVYVELPAFTGAADFLAKLRRARIVRDPSRWRLRLEALAAAMAGR